MGRPRLRRATLIYGEAVRVPQARGTLVKVPAGDGYRAMADRTALKVLIRP